MLKSTPSFRPLSQSSTTSPSRCSVSRSGSSPSRARRRCSRARPTRTARRKERVSSSCDHMYVQHAPTLQSVSEQRGMRPRDRPRSRTFGPLEDPPDCQLSLHRLGPRDCLVVAGQVGGQRDSSSFSPTTIHLALRCSTLLDFFLIGQQTDLNVSPKSPRCRQLPFPSRSLPFSASRTTS